MRSVPHRVVCLVGLDDGAFPRVGSIDGDDALLRESSDEVTLLGNGCLCCNTRTDLQNTLRRLVADRERRPEAVTRLARPVHADLAGVIADPVAEPGRIFGRQRGGFRIVKIDHADVAGAQEVAEQRKALETRITEATEARLAPGSEAARCSRPRRYASITSP